ncbi:MATH domain and coiled-coil domain-containing protein [Trifolium repens]|nr:MATH domain and coiled-coil domain-containing protein [Trifolium repens]
MGTSSEYFEKFTWKIEDFSKKNGMKLKSKDFKIRGYTWRILVHPLRKDVDHFTFYLMVADSLPPYGWNRNTFFKLVLINQLDKKKSIIKETQQKFNGGYRCWGSFFLNLKDFNDHRKGYLVKDTCIIEVHICVSNFAPKIHDINSLNQNSTPTIDQSSDEREILSPRTSGSTSSPNEEGEIKSSDLTLREFLDFDSLKPEEKYLVPLLDEVCTWRPSLIQSQMTKTRLFRQWAFTSLGQVLHFLKTKNVKDMTEDDIKNLRSLWEELAKSSEFELSWLEPYVQSALGVKAHLERAKKLKKLKDKVVALDIKMKKLRDELSASQAQYEVARRGLSEVRNGFKEMNINAPIGYAMF